MGMDMAVVTIVSAKLNTVLDFILVVLYVLQVSYVSHCTHGWLGFSAGFSC